MTDYATDRITLRDLVNLYATAVDRRDYELFESIGTDDCILHGAGMRFEGIDQIIEGMRAIEQFKSTYHAVHNQLVTIEGDKAEGEVYCVASHLYDKDQVEMKLDWGIRYHDHYQRTDAGWRIKERLINIDWTQDLATGS
jgi:ketosteroid isomerase-like protein